MSTVYAHHSHQSFFPIQFLLCVVPPYEFMNVFNVTCMYMSLELVALDWITYQGAHL